MLCDIKILTLFFTPISDADHEWGGRELDKSDPFPPASWIPNDVIKRAPRSHEESSFVLPSVYRKHNKQLPIVGLLTRGLSLRASDQVKPLFVDLSRVLTHTCVFIWTMAIENEADAAYQLYVVSMTIRFGQAILDSWLASCPMAPRWQRSMPRSLAGWTMCHLPRHAQEDLRGSR
jgi:hypothetical protein